MRESLIFLNLFFFVSFVDKMNVFRGRIVNEYRIFYFFPDFTHAQIVSHKHFKSPSEMMYGGIR